MKKILFLLFSVILLTSCYKDDDTIIYTVTGTSVNGFDVTYDVNGNTEQQSKVQSGWTKTFSQKESSFLYISAQANSTNATVKCTITKNSGVIKEASSKGDYVIATASN